MEEDKGEWEAEQGVEVTEDDSDPDVYEKSLRENKLFTNPM